MVSEENTDQVPPPQDQSSNSLTTEFLEDDEDFATLYKDSVSGFTEFQIVNGKVVDIKKDFVIVDIGFKSEGQIDISEFLNASDELTVKLDDEIEVFLEAVEDSDGIVVLSKEKAEKLRIWERVGAIYEAEGTVEGVIASRIKGGLAVDIGIKAFLPGSQVDLRPVRNLDKLIGESFEFKILKFNQKRGNIVLSRRALLEVDREERRKKTLEILTEGVLIKGFVKNITDYGVFIDLGGVDGLLHITDMTWGRIVHPSEMFNIGDEVEVMVLKFDREEEKVSLGIKQKFPNPWDSVEEKYPIGSRVEGRIVSLTDYGAFVELEEGVEGLIHVSEMSWTRKVRHPSKIFTINQTVEALVKDLDVERKRISLSIKDAEPNPWDTIHLRYPVGSIVSGKVRNITDFGIFVGLEEGIDGLVHISDLSWSQRQRKPSVFAKKGDDIEVKILHIDPQKERLSLGIKQMTDDPWKNLENKVHINDEISGRVVNVTEFGIFVEVTDGVEGLIHVSELDNNISKENLEQFYPVNSEIQAKVIKIDVDDRRLALSLTRAGEPGVDLSRGGEALKGVLAGAEEVVAAVEKAAAEREAASAAEESTDEPAEVQAESDKSEEASAPVAADAESEEPEEASESVAAEAEDDGSSSDEAPEPAAAEAEADESPPAESGEASETVEEAT